MLARRTLSLVAAALTLGAAACSPSSPRLSASPESAAPLDAVIMPPHYGQIPLHLSRPAYVALFEVIPGRGASLLYPQWGNGFVQVREAWVPLRYSPQRWMYAGNAHSSMNRISNYGYGYGSGSFYPVHQAPRYLFLIASEEPMAIERFQGEIGAIRSYLGHSQYVSMRPEETMEQLAYAILPYMSEDSWITDVYVDWGFDWGAGAGFGTMASYSTMQTVRCADGRIAYAPWRSGWGFEYLPCVPMQWAGVPGTDIPGVPGVPQPGDSTAVPAPADGRGRTGGSEEEEGRGRVRNATTNSQVITDEAAIRTTLNNLREQGQRTRLSGDLPDRLKHDVRLRQRADALSGGTGPVAAREQSGRPATESGSSSVSTRRDGTSASDGRAAERRRAAERQRVERDRREAAERGRTRSRPEAQPRRESPAPSTQSPAPSEPRSRPSSPPPSSGGDPGSQGSSGGRSRIPPPA